MGTKSSVRTEDGIAWITLDDGKVNAISTAMIAEIDAALDAAESAGDVVVLQDRQGIFSAGFDLAAFRSGQEATVALLTAGARLIVRLLLFPRPVLTVCAGHAYPAGAFLMMSADVRFAADGPFKIGMNEVAIGLTLPYFAVELARHRLTPPGFARVTTGGLFPPEEARGFGYVDRVLAPDALADAVREEALRLRALDMPSFAATKLRINGQAADAVRRAAESELKTVLG